MSVFVIEDEIHAELDGEFPTLDGAVADLRWRATVPWDKPPNRAPCTSWRTCGRHYLIREYAETMSGNLLRRIDMLTISPSGSEWTKGDEGMRGPKAST